MLGKTAKTLRIKSDDKPKVKRLEWQPSERMVLVELEGKPEMPSTVLIPQEQVAVIIPKPKDMNEKYELFLDDDIPSPAEQLAAANARSAAVRAEHEATKAKLPDESVSSSKLGERDVVVKKADMAEIRSTPKKRRGRPKKKKAE
jgi:hypothetical protein